MATTPGSGGGDCTITVERTTEHADDIDAGGEEERLKWLNMMAFCVALLEWAGNAVGTLASLWATVVLPGGFCSLLTPKDFLFSTIMIFIEATRVFIRSDALVNRWLFGSTSAFRWEHFCLRPRLVSPMRANLFALFTGTCISVMDAVFWPEIVTSTIKVAVLVITSQMLSRLRGRVAKHCLGLVAIAAYCGGSYGFLKAPPKAPIGKELKGILKIGPSIIAWELGTVFLVRLAAVINRSARQDARALGVIKVITAVALACLPLSQEILGSYYRYASISVALGLLILSTPVNSPPFLVKRHFFRIVDEIMPILFFWSVMFPLPGISLKASIYMLFSLTAAVLIGNLLIPLALLQVLLSILRLGNLLLGHHHHDYRPLPIGASPNLVPSIVVFFFLELCQGSFYLIASLPGLFSLPFHRWLAHALRFKQDWGPKAVSLYFLQAYRTRTEKGLIRPEKQEYTRSLDRFAIESLGATSSHEMQIVALKILDNCLRRQRDPKSNKKLVTEIIVKDSKSIITKIIGLISYLTEEENCGAPQRIENTEQNNFVSRMISFLIRFLTCCDEETSESSGEAHQKRRLEQMEVIRLSLEFVRRLITDGGKISARFRKELWENPFFLDSLYDILSLENCQAELWEPVMGIIATLALDEAARQEIGSTPSTILKLLMRAFLIPSENSAGSVRMAAGKALENLTMTSAVGADNCCDISLADPGLNLINNLIELLENEEYMSVAANLLHNLCANSRDNMMDINFHANRPLESTLLPKVMEMVRTTDGKQLEAALCVASRIGYVIPEYFAQMLESDTDAAAAELVQKLVDTLKSNMEPCLKHTRVRRHLVEMVLSIVEKCPSPSHRYIKILVEKGMKDALDMVKGTPSKFNGEGMFTQSLPMCDLINKAKRLINMVTPVQPTTKLENWKTGFASDALGAYYIAHPPIQPTKRNNTRTALVSVVGGSLRENDLIGYLNLLVRQNFVWKVQRYNNENTYKVVFPSRTDLLRTTYWGSAKLQNGLSLTFEEFQEEEVEYSGHLLPTVCVWMRVLNLPKILRKFKMIWAISSLFGVTQKIDMKTSRKNTFGRFCVAVLEPELIPNKMDVIIGNKYFQLKFEVEPLASNSGISNLVSNGSSNMHSDLMNNNTAQGIAEKGDLNMGSNAADNNMEEHEGVMQMEHSWEEDDLLGEDYDDGEDETAMRKFINVQENEPINVVKATSSFAQNIAMVQSSMDAYVASTSTGGASEKATTAQGSGGPAKTSAPRSTTRPSTTQGLQTARGPAAAPQQGLKAPQQQGLKTTAKDTTAPNKLVTNPIKTRGMKRTASSVDGTTGGGGSGADKSSLGGPLNWLLNSDVPANGTPNSVLGSESMMAMLSPRVSMNTLVQRSKRQAETTDMDSSSGGPRDEARGGLVLVSPRNNFLNKNGHPC